MLHEESANSERVNEIFSHGIIKVKHSRSHLVMSSTVHLKANFQFQIRSKY